MGLCSQTKPSEQGDYKYVRKGWIFLSRNCKDNNEVKTISGLLYIYYSVTICQTWKALQIFHEDKNVFSGTFLNLPHPY